MKTEYEIYMNFKKAEAEANKLRSIARSMKSLADDDFEGTLGRIKNNWTGENSDAFVAKARVVKDKISDTSTDIQRVADTIISIAERTRKAELDAINVAKA